MKIRTFQTQLWLPLLPAEVFPFFADARNLEAITPPWLRFEVLTPGPILMRPGALIDYRLKVHGFPLRWQTVISAWEPPGRFVDEQLHGPYRLWRHEHVFVERDGGALCLDRVEYCAPGGWLVDRAFVRREIERIFHYRQSALPRALGVDPRGAVPRPIPIAS